MKGLKMIYLLFGYFIVSVFFSGNCFSFHMEKLNSSDNMPISPAEAKLFAKKFLIINALDTVVFDFSQSICTPTYVQVPVFFLSNDTVYALDFALKFNPSEFSYNSLINHKPYLNNSISFNSSDSTLRFSTFSMTQIENNSPLVSVRFNIVSGMISLASFISIETLLNGDDCSYKSKNLPPAPPITSGGISSIASGDSVALNINVPAGATNLWSTGASTPTIWVYNAGTYAVAVTNAAGCTSSSYITLNSIDPLPVELLEFYGSNSGNEIELTWSTASEVNNDRFSLEYSQDAITWKILTEIAGAGTTSNINNYSFSHESPQAGHNYYRLKQYDYDGSFRMSDIITVQFSRQKTYADLLVNPNPFPSDENYLSLSVSSNELSGQLRLLDLNGKIIFEENIFVQPISSTTGTMSLIVKITIPPGIYIVRWSDNSRLAVTRLIVL